MKQTHIVGLIVLLLSIGTAASAQKVKVDIDTHYNFSTIKTFGWAEGQMAKNPIIAELIKRSINDELTSRGLMMNEAAPDIMVSVMAATDIGLQGVGPSWNPEYRSWGGYINPNALMNVTSGTLLVDLVETKNKISIWRGVASDTLNASASGDHLKDAKVAEKTVKSAVRKMFKKYPIKQI